MRLNQQQLSDLIRDHPGAVDDALEQALRDTGEITRLADLTATVQAAGGALTEGGLLADLLADTKLEKRFLAVLRARQVVTDRFDPAKAPQPSAEDIAGLPVGQIAGPGIDWETFGDFIAKILNFRCKILLDGKAEGSGAIVSPRLVLTAGHVVARTQSGDGPRPRIKVEAGDGKTYSAHVVWYRPPHKADVEGGELPAAEAARHCDAALLQLERPLGRMLGTMPLPDKPVAWTGTGHFVLVHYPNGKKTGWMPGAIRRNAAGESRLYHNVATEGGSSGGPGFDRDFAFMGLHQGRRDGVRRIVPYDQFADNTEFRGHLQMDDTPDYPWSLDGSLTGEFIIGRHQFYDALMRITDGSLGMLRGVWIRRADQSSTHGLAFSHRMLTRFLDAMGTAATPAPHRVLRLAPELGTTDLIAELAAIAGLGTTVANAGVAAGQTTATTQGRDRAVQLAQMLNATALAAGQTIWVYIDNPPAGLTTEIQTQLEHLVEALLGQPAIRLMLAGMETYRLVERQFDTPETARHAGAPGVFAERIGPFSRDDVVQTARAISRGLRLNWTEDVVAHMVDRALDTVPPRADQRFDLDALADVARRLRSEVKKDFKRISRRPLPKCGDPPARASQDPSPPSPASPAPPPQPPPVSPQATP